jgi:hypothetical protein
LWRRYTGNIHLAKHPLNPNTVSLESESSAKQFLSTEGFKPAYSLTVKVIDHECPVSIVRHINPAVSQEMLYIVSVETMVMPSLRQPTSNIEEMELLAMVQVMVLLLFG